MCATGGERPEQQYPPRLVEVDAAAEQDVVGGAIGPGEALGGEVGFGLYLVAGLVASLERDPGPPDQDCHVTGLERDRLPDAVGAQPGPATHHREELHRVAERAARAPAAARGDATGQDAAHLDELEHLGQTITGHVRTIAHEMWTNKHSEFRGQGEG